MSAPVVVLGGGGHAAVVIDALRACGREVLGVVDPGLPQGSKGPLGVAVLGDDDRVLAMAPAEVRLANGLGSTSTSSLAARAALFERFAERGYRFETLVHPSAVVASEVEIGEGSQIMAGAVVQTGGVIGRDALVNTRASIDHHARLGDHVHVAPGAVLSGSVEVGERTHIGAAACVIQSVRIGAGCLVAAGAVVRSDLAPGTKWVPR